jgi:hypothetical protein
MKKQNQSYRAFIPIVGNNLNIICPQYCVGKQRDCLEVLSKEPWFEGCFFEMLSGVFAFIGNSMGSA